MSYSVLIVDDSLTVRMDLADSLTEAGFRAFPCASAAEARAMLANDRFDVIVLDVRLPDGNGVDLLEEIRSRPDGAQCAVVLLSSEAEIADRIRGLQMGANEYIGKPYDTDYLIAKVEELARRNRTGDTPLVLVIDDSATFRGALRDVLEGAGHDVIEARTGEEGLRIAATRRPDAILVDGVLPDIDGPTVIRHLRLDAALRDTPCLLLTASEGKHAQLRALDAGADAFIQKQDDLSLIVARLEAMIRSSPNLQRSDETRSLLGLRKILVVDNDDVYLELVADALKDEGYDVIIGHSGEEALQLLAVQSVDCILLDLHMPGLGGTETCKRIKAAPIVRDIPLIIVSELEEQDAMVNGLRAGADDYLSKANDLEVLRARVRARIRRKQFEDEDRRIREELLRRELEASEARAARELAETRAILVDELERKNKELEAFSYSVSHDLRTPLNAIRGFTQLVLDHYGNALDPKGREYLNRVAVAGGRMDELISDLLELSRVSRAELLRADVDLSALARDVVTTLRKDSERTVDVRIDDGIEAETDGRLIRIVLENLLGNGWKFTAKTSAPRLEFGTTIVDGTKVFVVRDNGAGFDMQFQDRLFRPFHRLHSDADFAGTGIGLATVARIIERHGGRIWAESAVGVGTSFYFTLASSRSGSSAPS